MARKGIGQDQEEGELFPAYHGSRTVETVHVLGKCANAGDGEHDCNDPTREADCVRGTGVDGNAPRVIPTDDPEWMADRIRQLEEDNRRAYEAHNRMKTERDQARESHNVLFAKVQRAMQVLE